MFYRCGRQHNGKTSSGNQPIQKIISMDLTVIAPIAWEHFVVWCGKGLWSIKHADCVQQEQDCLQLNEQINTAFIWLIAFSTDNFSSSLEWANTLDPAARGVNSRPKCNSTIYFIGSEWRAGVKEWAGVESIQYEYRARKSTTLIWMHNKWLAESIRATIRDFMRIKCVRFLIKIFKKKREIWLLNLWECAA